MAKVKKQKERTIDNWWNQVRRYDFRQAMEKILFTMIGLWLALWLNNWNDRVKKKHDERLMLVQLESAFQHDLQDIAETIVGYQYRVDGCTFLLKHIKNNYPVTDSLRQALQALNGYSYLAANKGAYETLKSRGLDLISNDSIRLRIATLYEVDYAIAERSEEFFHKIYTEQIIPYLFTQMSWQSMGLEPVNWEKDQKSNQFRQLVNTSYYNNQFILDKYHGLHTVVSALKKDIEHEIEKQ